MGSSSLPSKGEDKEEQPNKRKLHPHALKKRVSAQTLNRQRRQRRALFITNTLTTFLFVGASLGWGPMQQMVCNNKPSCENSLEVAGTTGNFVYVDSRHGSDSHILFFLYSWKLMDPFLKNAPKKNKKMTSSAAHRRRSWSKWA
jgi:hypothetical protein